MGGGPTGPCQPAENGDFAADFRHHLFASPAFGTADKHVWRVPFESPCDDLAGRVFGFEKVVDMRVTPVYGFQDTGDRYRLAAVILRRKGMMSKHRNGQGQQPKQNTGYNNAFHGKLQGLDFLIMASPT